LQDNDLLESILSSLSNEVRVEILKLISREGALSFTEIMEKLQMDPKSDAGKFGYHLRMLTDADGHKMTTAAPSPTDRWDRKRDHILSR